MKFAATAKCNHQTTQHFDPSAAEDDVKFTLRAVDCSRLAFSTGPKNTFVDEERVKVVWSRIYVWPDTDDIELEQREPIWHVGAFAWQDSFWNAKISPAR